MTESLLSLAQVSSKVGLRRTAIYGRIAAGTFPAPVKIGTISRWPDSEVEAWIAALKAERDGDQNGDRLVA